MGSNCYSEASKRHSGAYHPHYDVSANGYDGSINDLRCSANDLRCSAKDLRCTQSWVSCFLIRFSVGSATRSVRRIESQANLTTTSRGLRKGSSRNEMLPLGTLFCESLLY